MEPEWLKLARSLQAIAQNGLEYSDGVYDKERYKDVRNIALRMMELGSDTRIECIQNLFAKQTGYATPKVDVRAVILREEQVLLVQEKTDQRWALPGGWADVNLSAGQNAEKETEEEAALEVRAERLLAVYDRSQHHHPPFPFHVYKFFIHCVVVSGEPSPGLETMGAEFFSLSSLPPLSTGRVNEMQVHRMVEILQHPDWPTEFD